MSSNVIKIATALGLALALVLGVAAYSVLKTPEQASSPIEAIPLTASAAETPALSSQTQTAPVVTEAASATDAPATSQVDPPSAATASATDLPVEAAAAEPIIAQIVQEESEARFVIDEVLNGAPKTVVGTTNQVAGELAVDPADPHASRVGVIQINARTLTTDSDFRNRAIKNQILLTDEYEYITFTPTELAGLPQQASAGESYNFQIVGDLTIRDVTKQVTFDVTATPVSERRLEGTASAMIAYADFGLTIPQVRQVASVADRVRLELDFVAVPA